MKNLKINLQQFIYLPLLLILLNTFNLKAQDCATKLREMNRIESGIPSGRITEYEDCVGQLEGDKVSNKDLLNDSYNKLIQYYNALDNQTKVDLYRRKMNELPK